MVSDGANPEQAEDLSAEPKRVEIFTDGACLGNPGPGGYGALLRFGMRQLELSAGYHRTTNNRMELMAAIQALSTLKRTSCQVRLTTDSKYLQKGIQIWLPKWVASSWRRSDRKPVKNRDLWQWLVEVSRPHRLEWCWVRGHSGHPENERCDQLASAAALAPSRVDEGYDVQASRPAARTEGPGSLL